MRQRHKSRPRGLWNHNKATVAVTVGALFLLRAIGCIQASGDLDDDREHRCRALGDHHYGCSNMNFRASKKANLGVKQSLMEGYSDEEKKAVLRARDRMEEYIDQEYDNWSDEVKKRCRNENELCTYWASVGECNSSRRYMLLSCPAVCRLCVLVDTFFKYNALDESDRVAVMSYGS